MTETGKKPPHETLDAQLVRYWEREAARFDELSARASFGWIARNYARRAQRAREKAERSRAKEVARGRLPASALAAHGGGDSPS
ncbi:hypothetical protein [Methylorubrum podarium]|jgi:hypothetical protein|uniref:hypothetical protein n=1 Tax=Methylorubrum podarium TaxID=200476 RepID=UPI001EE1BAE7|nr:hypothetical protein [Methylorubrum podarium]MDV2984788.1 hypothetical protein [Methylobacteriaceae bacterium AG10]GJE69417.1 hypothetical protein CHKEEEPN_0945 [Methylorubrum podarium]